MIEDVKYLINKLNVNGDGAAAFYTLSGNQMHNIYQLPAEFSFAMNLAEGVRLFAISRNDYKAFGVKSKFLKVRQTYDNFLVVSMPGKYLP